MQHPREEIYQAVFDIAAQAPGLKTTSRRNQYFANVPAEIQPALYMEQIGENPMDKGYGMPYMWTLNVMFQVFVWEGDENKPPASLMNPILDYLEQMFPPDTMSPSYTLSTLCQAPPGQCIPGTGGFGINGSGLVYECRLYGDSKSIAGSFGPQAFAFVPARIISF